MINEEIWNLLETFSENNPNSKCKKFSDEAIIEAEKSLNLRFSDFYRFFLQNYPVTNIFEFPINTLSSDRCVVKATQKFRDAKNYFEYNDFYIISKTNDGYPIGVDPKGRVSTINHKTETKEVIAENFEDFIAHALSVNA